MIRRFAVTSVLAATAAAALVAGTGTAIAAPATTDVAMTTLAGPPHHNPPGPPHGPGWDGKHGNWDGHSGPGRGGGWDGNGGGWDGHHWWVSPQRCRAGHGRVIGDNHHPGAVCRGGAFNGSPIHF